MAYNYGDGHLGLVAFLTARMIIESSPLSNYLDMRIWTETSRPQMGPAYNLEHIIVSLLTTRLGIRTAKLPTNQNIGAAHDPLVLDVS